MSLCVAPKTQIYINRCHDDINHYVSFFYMSNFNLKYKLAPVQYIYDDKHPHASVSVKHMFDVHVSGLQGSVGL